jgi:predicted metalloprotease
MVGTARRRRWRWARLAAALLCLLALSGCATVVLGEGLPGRPPATDAGEGDTGVAGATTEEVDVLARNALADLEVFWADQLPEVFGIPFEPLAGGYFSVDPGNVDPSQYPRGIGCGADPRELENNAFYCVAADAPNSDSISYDRRFLAELGADYGRFIPALVMAHEFGHAVQARVGFPPASIVAETQADCLAGAWTRWVAEGEAEHSVLRTPELDELLRGYLLLRDPVGTSSAEESAHGSYFDRVSAFQEGFDSGAEACRDNFTERRPFTQDVLRGEEQANAGNAEYGELLDIVSETLRDEWDQAFAEDLDAEFEPPTIEPFDGEAPGCAPDGELDVVYCADEQLVGFDDADLGVPAYEQIGDFATAMAVALPYGLAARDQLGLSTDDEEALRSTVCLSGWYAGELWAVPVETRQLSAGDVDEAVQFLLTFGNEPTVVPAADLTGFELVDLFRTGFAEGLDACL